MIEPRHLAAARVMAGWSQEELAGAAGVAMNTVQGLESGGRDTRFSSVARIVEALRSRGVEFAGASDRYAGGILVVRGSFADRAVRPEEAATGEADVSRPST